MEDRRSNCDHVVGYSNHDISSNDRWFLRLNLTGSNKSWYVIWFLLSSFSCSLVHSSSDNNGGEYLDALFQDHAYKTLVQRRPHTGSLYNATLPSSLAGMEVSLVRLRSRTLWRRGANFGNFHIPSKTLPTPYVRRLLVVYQDLGNWSSYYYNVSGYSLVSSVVGFMVYDASNLSSKNMMKLDLNTRGKPISIRFLNTALSRGTTSRTKCATFQANREVSLRDTRLPGVCYSTSQGHFSIVAPIRRKQRIWDMWVMGFVLGFFALIVVGAVGMVFVRILTAKRVHEMERQADEGVVLETIWIGYSKMPSATSTRTHPILEHPDLP
ncbi:unnamed protein product [Ilex paraguariensis]|uniref:Uncharacterized protein n=1 Tax=Ilex paraguariensis TaxID=185542 RepID=A0ABC8T0V6_9AQUA